MDDLIKRADAIEAIKGNSYLDDDYIEINGYGAIEDIRTLPSADRPQLDKDVVEPIGNGNVIMSEDTYEELLSRPQGYWIQIDAATYRCSECGKIQIADDINELNFCCCCGSRNKVRRLKGADDEH